MAKISGTADSANRETPHIFMTYRPALRSAARPPVARYWHQYAIAFVADKLETDESTIISKIASVTGVSSSGTVAQASRFHDDKSTYTGSHAAGGTLANIALTLFFCHNFGRQAQNWRL